jgi:hypothetical protein
MKHILRILDKTGDTAVEWAPTDAAETAEAEAKFNELKASSQYLMFAVPASKREKPTQIRSFEPTATEIIAVPRFQGG